MTRGAITSACLAVMGTMASLMLPPAFSQETKPAPRSSSTGAGATGEGDVRLPLAVPGDQVVIKRDAVKPIDPQRYRTALYLTPMKTVRLVAPYDGVVQALPAKLGESVQAQGEIARLDNTIPKFRVQRAQSLYKAAVLEQKLTADGASADQKELAQAKVDAAKADLDLAQFVLEQTSLRIPFVGEVTRFHVSEGQFVRAGDLVATVGDTTRLTVEIPVERSKIDRAKAYGIKIDGVEQEAQVQAVIPLDQKFDPLREMFDSLASAVLIVENAKRNFQPGQTVFVPLIPRHPVVEVPTSAIANRQDGGRKVQVLREFVVRDIHVEVMGSVGSDRVFVNGPFAEGDEVIFESSHQLTDGFPVKPGSGKGAKGDPAKPEVKGEPKTAPGTDF